MEIKKNELLNFIKTSEGQSVEKEPRPKSPTAENLPPGAAGKRGSLSLDQLRSQVMSLQDGVKDIQTQLSYNQAQAAFLDSLKDKRDWQGELFRFMKDHFRNTPILQDPEFSHRMKASPDWESFQDLLRRDNEKLKSDLIVKEVQIENILSTGLVSVAATNHGEELIKDIAQSEEMFGKLRSDQILNLLKGQ